MNIIALPPTLYEDWQVRRARLGELPADKADSHLAELRLLDYLLRRYRNAPEAARPARFALKPELYFNRRAFVVLHHLGGGPGRTVSTRQQAETHVQAVVQRMFATPLDPPAEAFEGPSGLQLLPSREDRAEALRARLCDADPTARVLAAVGLGRIGTLDDIGLLADVLSLPEAPDEHPRERAAILHAMQRLAGATTEEFDLREVLPPPAPGDAGIQPEGTLPGSAIRCVAAMLVAGIGCGVAEGLDTAILVNPIIAVACGILGFVSGACCVGFYMWPRQWMNRWDLPCLVLFVLLMSSSVVAMDAGNLRGSHP